MLVKGERTGPRGAIFGVVLIGVGLALGVLRPWETWGGGAVTPILPTSLAVGATAGLPPPLPASLAENGLPVLRIELSPGAVASLERERNLALQRGLIVQSDDAMVDATVDFGDESMAALVRLKGDWIDHVKSDKWSLRIELQEGAVLGMTRFSIQAPFTRGGLTGWLMMEAARREGLLAPRGTFVNVEINGGNRGVYFLEEHFSKELLESQGRREGPIVRFDESTLWDTRLQYHTAFSGSGTPRPVLSAGLPGAAEVGAFGEGRLSRIDSLNRQLDSALEKVRTLQEEMVAANDFYDQSRRLDALRATQGKAVEEIIDVRSTAAMHALATLFRREHGLYWHNMRFYHNPVRQRLEPIVFDASSGGDRQDPFDVAGRLFAQFLASDRYQLELFGHLARMSRPEYLDSFMADVGPQVDVFERAIKAEKAYLGRDAAEIFADLHEQQIYLLELLNPPDPVNFDARWVHSETTDGLDGGFLEVDAWATTRVPIIIEGFRFSNGRLVRAESARDGDAPVGTRLEGGRVLLPLDGGRHTFRFPIDERLAALRRIEEEKAAARSTGAETPDTAMPAIQVEYHTAASAASVSELLALRRSESRWADEGGRPKPPTIEEALQRHEFLAYDTEVGELVVTAGDWRLTEDLVVPDRVPLRIEAGTRLAFEKTAALITTGPLRFEGTPNHRIVLESASPGDSFDGIIVLDAPEESVWENVTVRRAGELHRAGWIMTGGVTFYHSPVRMTDCAFEDARGEDALNVFGCPLHLERVHVAGTFSDGVDGDFIEGDVLDCLFEGTAADAVDVSGSHLLVRGCRFNRIGDKCVSAGESSDVTVEDCVVSGASIGIASKDNASVAVRGFKGDGIINYALAAYTKKPEYGPSSIDAEGVEFGNCGRGLCLAQTGHEILINGQPMPTSEVDVGEMYRQKILGQ